MPDQPQGRLVVLASGNPLAGERSALWRNWPSKWRAEVSLDPYSALAVVADGGPWLVPHRSYPVRAGQVAPEGASRANGPLTGLDVLLTRPLASSRRMGLAIGQLGARQLYCPLWCYAPPTDANGGAHWAEDGPWDAVLVTSAEAARRAAEQIRSSQPRVLAAVGEATAQVLDRAGIRVQVVGQGGGASLAAQLVPVLPSGARVAVLRAEAAPGRLLQLLRAQGWLAREVTTHRLIMVPRSALAGLSQVVAASTDPWALVFNGRTAAFLASLLDAAAVGRLKLAVIGPETAEVARECGLQVAVTAAQPSWRRLLAQLVAERGDG